MPDPKAADSAAKQVLYTPEEAAQRASLTRNWLITKAREGKIPHWREGKTVRFSDEDLSWIKERFSRPVDGGRHES